jgi:hypothetical protein
VECGTPHGGHCANGAGWAPHNPDGWHLLWRLGAGHCEIGLTRPTNTHRLPANAVLTESSTRP